MTKKQEEAGLKVIYGHRGKRITYETYQENNPDLAEKYLEFISKNKTAQYIVWNAERKKFVG